MFFVLIFFFLCFFFFRFVQPPSHPDIKNNNKEAKVPKSASQKGKCQVGSKTSKLPSWSQDQLQEAITSVITQRMRFTQASSRFSIPKGTLYDNILGKSRRMKALEEVGLTTSEELAVLEFCCEISSMPYNRRTSRSLHSILEYVRNLKEGKFELSVRKGFKWWWAFCKKYSIISLYFDNSKDNENTAKFLQEEAKKEVKTEIDEEEKDDEIDVEAIDEDSNDSPITRLSSPMFHAPSPLLNSPPPAHQQHAQAAAAAALMAFFPSPMSMPHQFMPFVLPQQSPVQDANQSSSLLKSPSSLTAAK